MFNPIDYPICLMLPDRMTQVGAWHGHDPFAFVLVDILRPSRFVELGVQMGDSYSTICQAMQTLKYGGKAFGIDTWMGDKHTGSYDENVFNSITSYNQRNFKDFSTLIRKSFDDALADFEDSSIDLLHIDGLHTYEAVQHDFEKWQPKVKPDGIILLHDTNVFHFDFGVYKLWRELEKQYPNHFDFKHSNGLGMLSPALDKPHPNPKLHPFFEASDHEIYRIRNFFSLLGDRVGVHRKLRGNSL